MFEDCPVDTFTYEFLLFQGILRGFARLILDWYLSVVSQNMFLR
jgi:hypothetical protein